jgi:DNA-binding transcriptional MerR regulator
MHQIGGVSDAVGLSLRTIRHYEEVGLVVPSGRSPGGFRLYTDRDVDRLRLVKRMKPLNFSLEEIRDVLALLDSHTGEADDGERSALGDRFDMYAALAAERCERLRDQLAAASEFADMLNKAARATRGVAARSR